MKLRSLGLVSVAFSAAAISSLEPVYAGNLFGIRTDPMVPIAGQPFEVVATSNPCFGLFTGAQPNGEGGFAFGGVSVNGSVVTANWGVVNVLNCSLPAFEVRQPGPALAPGIYTLNMVLQGLPDGAASPVVESIQFQVATTQATRIPAMGSIAAWGAAIGVLALAFAATRREKRGLRKNGSAEKGVRVISFAG